MRTSFLHGMWTLGFILGTLSSSFAQAPRETVSGLPPNIAERAQTATNFYYRMGRRQAGIDMIVETIRLSEEALGRNHPANSQLHNAASVMFQHERIFNQGLVHAERALECAAGFSDPADVSIQRAKNSQALCLLNLGRADEAVSSYRQLLELFREKGEPEGIFQTTIGLGSALRELGRYPEAERLLIDALDTQKKDPNPDPKTLSQSLSTLGSFYAELGDDERAHVYYLDALKVSRQALGNGNPLLIDRLTGLARTLRHLKEYGPARTLVDEARQIVLSSGGSSSPQLSLVNGTAGAIEADAGEYDRAISLFSDSHERMLQRFGPAYPGRERALNNIGFLKTLNGDLDAAKPMLAEALAIIEGDLGENSADAANASINLSMHAALGDRPDEAVARLTEGNIRYEAVLRSVAGLGSDTQKLSFLQKLSGKTNFAISLHREMFPNHPGAREAALLTILQRKGRAADLTMRSRVSDPNDPRLAQRNLLLSNIAKLAIGESRLAPGTAKQQAWSWQQELEKLESELIRDNPDSVARPVDVFIQSVADRLEDGEILVEYVVFRPVRPDVPKSKHESIALHCAAYVLFPAGEIMSVDLGELGPIESNVSALRAGLSQPGSERFREPARELDRLVAEPIRNLSGGVSRWRISPEGPLNLVPFSALLDASGRFLIETHDFTYLSSGRDLLREPAEGERGPAILIANPDYDSQPGAGGPQTAQRSAAFGELKFSPLPGTLEEAKALHVLIPNAKVYIGAKATEQEVKNSVNPILLHVATHGFFLSNEPAFAGARGLKRKKQQPPPSQTAGPSRPSFFALESPLVRSGLAFAGANHLKSGDEDGILTALEVTGLNLKKTRLVVLSACETGVGEVVSGEGVYGLRRAFHLAGAESQVLSLWKVHDDATRQLMESLYTGLKGGGSRSESLRKARLSLLRDGPYQHPAYWAAFILSGDKGPLAAASPAAAASTR